LQDNPTGKWMLARWNTRWNSNINRENHEKDITEYNWLHIISNEHFKWQ
jgi:hypothetical protein